MIPVSCISFGNAVETMWVQSASLNLAPAAVAIANEDKVLLGQELAEVPEFSQAPAPARMP